jgi:hypothetical protein
MFTAVTASYTTAGDVTCCDGLMAGGEAAGAPARSSAMLHGAARARPCQTGQASFKKSPTRSSSNWRPGGCPGSNLGAHRRFRRHLACRGTPQPSAAVARNAPFGLSRRCCSTEGWRSFWSRLSLKTRLSPQRAVAATCRSTGIGRQETARSGASTAKDLPFARPQPLTATDPSWALRGWSTAPTADINPLVGLQTPWPHQTSAGFRRRGVCAMRMLVIGASVPAHRPVMRTKWLNLRS